MSGDRKLLLCAAPCSTRLARRLPISLPCLPFALSPAQRLRFGDDAIVDQSFEYSFPLLRRTHRNAIEDDGEHAGLSRHRFVQIFFRILRIVGIEIFFFLDAGESGQRFFTNARILEEKIEPVKIDGHEPPGEIALGAQEFFGCHRDTLWKSDIESAEIQKFALAHLLAAKRVNREEHCAVELAAREARHDLGHAAYLNHGDVIPFRI